MGTITISRMDGPAAVFDPSKTLRITRGLSSPTVGQRTPRTEVTIDDPWPIIHTDESLEHILAKVGNSAPMVRLTAPDGSPIAVNAKKVVDIREPDPFDIKGIPGVVDDLDAHAQFFVERYRDFVKETVEEVKQIIGKATT